LPFGWETELVGVLIKLRFCNFILRNTYDREERGFRQLSGEEASVEQVKARDCFSDHLTEISDSSAKKLPLRMVIAFRYAFRMANEDKIQTDTLKTFLAAGEQFFRFNGGKNTPNILENFANRVAELKGSIDRA